MPADDRDDVERAIDAAIARAGEDERAELERAGSLHPRGVHDRLEAPAAFRRALAWALREPAPHHELARHYLERSPRMRVGQVAGGAEPEATVFHTELAWDRLPRLGAAIDRLYAELAGVPEEATVRALGAPAADAWRARSTTLAAAYARTYYGGMMPLLHGQAGDLAYFLRRAGERNLDVLAAIDRYLTAPLVHELCHFGRDRDALEPLHLDECVGGWLCARVHPEFAFPAEGEDDAIYGTPWLAQVGLAIARAFGAAPVIAAHAGARSWESATTSAFVAAAARLGREDWRARRSLHLLADTLDPMPWVALALAGVNGRLDGVTLDTLRALPLRTLELPEDPAADRAIVEDALRAMCLEGFVADGTLRTRAALPAGAIVVDAAACTVASPRRGVDSVDPVHWIPPAVAARLAAALRSHGTNGIHVRLGALAKLADAATALCAGAVSVERDGFAIAPS